jgi:hypothetical protein
LFIATVASSALAQPRPTPENRERWKSELRNYKHDFMVRELDLSRDQQSKFFPLYDQMEDSIEQINTDTRELEKRIGDDASDIETEAAARALFEQKSREGQLELEYFDSFKTILTPRQLLKLKSAERQFMRRLMHHNRRMQSARQ